MNIDVEGDIVTSSNTKAGTPSTFRGFKLPNDGKLGFLNNIQLPLPLSKHEAGEWISKKKEAIRPWSVFFATSRFSQPKSAQRLSRRIVRNVDHFQSNYFFVFIGLFIYCLVTSPLLLFAFAAMLGVCYLVFVKNSDKRVTLFGKELTLAQQYSIIGLCSMPIFYLVGAGAVMFWVLGASCFLIMLHASFYDIDSLLEPEEESFELTMEEVV